MFSRYTAVMSFTKYLPPPEIVQLLVRTSPQLQLWFTPMSMCSRSRFQLTGGTNPQPQVEVLARGAYATLFPLVIPVLYYLPPVSAGAYVYSSGCDVVTGTPGRIADLVDSGKLVR
jgi:hypothetical protein